MILVWVLFAFSLHFCSAQSELQNGYGIQSELVNETDADGNFVRIRGFRNRADKDFVLGGFFPVHFDDPDSGGGECGSVRREGGLETVEAMLYALDVVNADPHLLPNVTLGYDIRDTCYIENIALEEALDLVIIGTEREAEACECLVYPTRPGNASLDQPVPTVGLIGATASRVTIPIASLGRLFEVPQISYASTSSLLTNRDRYTYFYRTITPDNIQAQAMIALMVHFGWNHISIIYSSNAYGTPARDEIVALAAENGICVDLDKGIGDGFSLSDYTTLAEDLNSSNAEVVIVFASQQNALLLLKKYTNISDHRRLTWIASEAWSNSVTVISSFNDTLVGLFGTRPSTKHVEGFEDYFLKLTIENNVRDPWFPEYFSVLTDCVLGGSCSTTASIPEVHDYQQEYTIPRVIEAVYSFAHALQNYLDDNCDQPVEWNRANYSCKGQKRALDGPTMLEYLGNVDFTSPTKNIISFNEFGYVTKDSYEIVNYQAVDSPDGSRDYQLEMVGVWKPADSEKNESILGEITFSGTQLQFGVSESGDIKLEPLIPQCGHCTPGQYLEPGFSSCCGSCKGCLGSEHSNESQASSCSKCDEFTWGNNPTQGSTHCEPVEETFLKFSHPWAVIMVVLSLLGLIAATVVTVIFVIYWKTPVVKSSGREQMILLLIGIFLSYMLAFIYVSPPVLAVCIIQRIGLWFCFSLMFGALMLKIIRVAYIFLRGTRSLKPLHFQKPKYMALFTCVAVAIQMVLILGSVLFQHPEVVRDLRQNSTNNFDTPTVVVSCNRDHLAFVILSLLYESALISVTAIVGIISFRYPKNYNEAKHISLCTFALAVIWIAFIPSYFATASFQEFQNATISLAVILSASAILICNFGPRLFIIFYNPDEEDNTFQSNIQTVLSLSSSTNQMNTKVIHPAPFLDTNDVNGSSKQRANVNTDLALHQSVGNETSKM